MTETRYGIIADIHGDPRRVYPLVEALRREGATKLLLNGDLGNETIVMGDDNLQIQLTDYQSISIVLDIIGKTGLEAYVSRGGVDKIFAQPGSHETVSGYTAAVTGSAQKYPNIINAIDMPFVEMGDHNLAFLPGSDFVRGGQYQIVPESGHPTGMYILLNQGIIPVNDRTNILRFMNDPRTREYLRFITNMGDLRKNVSDPEKTIIVSHVPPKFDSVEICIDYAHFCETQDGGVIPGIYADYLTRNEVVYKEIRANRGNEDLARILQEIGITKGIHNHFHESGGRANDWASNQVPEDQFVDELFYNCGSVEEGRCGLLIVRDGKVAYHNIRVKV